MKETSKPPLIPGPKGPRKWVAASIAGAFVVFGLLAIAYSLAAGPLAAFEPENGTLSGGTASVAVTGASGGKVAKFSTGATPTPTPTPTATATPTSTPVASGTWPSGWDDPRFVNMTNSGPRFNQGSSIVTWQNLSVDNDESGQATFGYGNYNLLNSRLRSREGPRISGSNILIQDTYIEVAGVGDDHGDGIQAYGSTSGANNNFKNVVIRRTKIVLKSALVAGKPVTALNAGIFLADRSGVDLTLQDVFVDGGPAPNGALFFANSANGSDKGCNSLRLNHVRVKPSVRFEGLSSCNIIEWTDVAYENGTPIPRP